MWQFDREQAISYRVKLPACWEKDMAAWFRLAEAVLEDNHVQDPGVKYRMVLLHSHHHHHHVYRIIFFN